MAVDSSEKVDSKVVFAEKTNWLLVMLGALLVALAAGGVYYARDKGSETKETTPVATSEANQTETTTTTTTKNAPSDTLLTAALATGAAIIVTGVLYNRISAIKLPGGVEIDLTDEEKETLAKKVGEELQGKPAEQVATATQKTLDLLRREKGRVGTLQLPESKIAQKVSEVAQSYK